MKKGLVCLFVIVLTLLSFTPYECCAAQEKNLELQDRAVFKEVLGNGLTLLIKESPQDNLVSIRVIVDAGPKTEDEYTASGISHLVEHMVFKGTALRKAGTIEKEVKSYGGFINGSVNQDTTEYHITVPPEYLDKAINLLKDMLMNASFERDEFAKEKEVILKEIRMNNDDPERALMKLLNENSYLVHPYKYPPIGYEDRFKAISRDDAVEYYNRMYVPNRMVMAIVGAVDPKDCITKVEKEFSNFRKPDYVARGIHRDEPPQMAKRSFEEERDISLSYIAMGFHSTSILNNDLFAMDVLSMILGRGDNSRLNKKLFKEAKLVHAVSCWNYTPGDPGLFVIRAILDKQNIDNAESAIIEELENIKRGRIDDKEIADAKQMVLSDFIFSRQTVDGESGDLASSQMLTGSHDFFIRYVKGVQAVTKDDIRRVSIRYLDPYNLTAIRLIPIEKKSVAPAKKNAVATLKNRAKKDTLPNGMRIIIRENKKIPVISITLAMSGGLGVENKNNNGISNLTARMLLNGTAIRKESEIKGSVESRGGNITAFSGLNGFGITVSILAPDLDQTLDLLKDIFTNSDFPQNELDREKSLMAALIKGEDDDIFAAGFNQIRELLYGDRQYGMRILGTPSSLEEITRQDIVNFYKTYCVPNNAVISVSGDVDMDAVMKKIKLSFVETSSKNLPEMPNTMKNLRTINARSAAMAKEESLLLLGFQTANILDPDRYAVDVLSSVMSGQSGRLFSVLRDKMSLAYTLGCVQQRGTYSGYLLFYVATTKDKLAKSKAALIEEMKKICSRPIDSAELELAKREITGENRIEMQTNEFCALRSALDELYGLGYDNIDNYEKEIVKVTTADVQKAADRYLDLDAYAELEIAP